MDPSVLWCLGPDFDKQTVLSLLGDHQYPDSFFMQPTTPTWLMSSPSQWNPAASMHEPPVYTPKSVMSELGAPHSPTSGATKRPFSDVSNRATCKEKHPFSSSLEFSSSVFEVNRSFNSQQQVPTKLEFSTPVRSMTPDLYNRVPSSSIKRSRMTPALATTTSTYETPPPAAPLPSAASTMDSAECVFHVSLF